MSDDDYGKVPDWPPIPRLKPRAAIQPALFHACEWHVRSDPDEDTLVHIDITGERPVAAPGPTRPGESRQTPAHILVKREMSPGGQHFRTYGKIVAIDYRNFEEADRDASERNRTDISHEDTMPSQHEYREAYELGHVPDLQAYAQAGLLAILPDGEELIRQVLRDWQEQNGPLAPEEHLIVADDRAMAARLNDACQLQRRANDESTAFARIESGEPNTRTLYEGDCVLISGAYPEPAVSNHRGVILASSNRDRLVVGLDNGRVAEILGHEVSTHVQLGYALTEDQAKHHSAKYAYVVVKDKNDRSPDASYRYSQDPTCTNLYVEHNRVDFRLQQFAEWGCQHGESVQTQWRDEHARSRQVEREMQQREQDRALDTDFTQER